MAEDKYQLTLEGSEVDEALRLLVDRIVEQMVYGTENGVDVPSSNEYYHNNAKYFAKLLQSVAPASVTEAVRWDIDQTALTDADKARARANIDAGKAGVHTNPNLLDNPWFTVNQRGATTETTNNAYIADRWFCTYGSGGYTATRESNGAITLTPSLSTSYATIRQKFDTALGAWLIGKTVTGSVLLNDGTILTGTTVLSGSSNTDIIARGAENIAFVWGYANKQVDVRSYAEAHTIKAVKLELGSVSTLANDTLPNYADELDRCQYYFERIAPDSSNLGIGVGIGNGSTLYIPIRIHPKAKFPTLTYSGEIGIGQTAYATNITAFTTSASSMGACIKSGNFQLAAQVSHTAGAAYRLILKTGSYIDFSADL